MNDEELTQLEAAFIERYKGSDQHPIRTLFKFYKGQYHLLILSAICYIIKKSPQWLIPIVTANLIDLVVEQPADMMPWIWGNVGVLALALVLNIPFHYAYVKLESVATRNVEAALRGALVRKLQHLSIGHYREMQSGRIQSKMMRDVEAIANLSSSIFMNGMEILINLVVAVSVVLSKNIYVFLFFVLCAPVSGVIGFLFRKKLRTLNRDYRHAVEETSAEVMDMVEMVPLSRAHALEETETTKMNHLLHGIAKRGLRLDITQSLFGATNWVVFEGFQLICLVFSVLMFLNNQIAVGDITLYQSYFTMLVSSVTMILALIPTFARGIEAVTSVGELMHAPEEEGGAGKPALSDVTGAYSFQNVGFAYEEGHPVLEGFDLEVSPGETVALVGESGVGKTTVINMVIGYHFPGEGTVTIDGHSIREIDLRSYRKHIAVVPQNTILFSGTIRENITYGLSNVSEEKLAEILEAARLTDTIAQLPKGLDTSVGEHGGKLSGGQRQRISIARALIRDPKVIILDEATSALDSVSEKMIQEALDHLTAGRTTFVVAHRLSTIKDADKIAVMEGGRCIEFGTYDELMEKKGAFYKYRQLQL
ncbi:MAG: ABC transporter ATP-binding protein [Ruminococcaceae bacterium]|nr:ABC transporter ATP-binding protein [Oscillospiraceae bacterium]